MTPRIIVYCLLGGLPLTIAAMGAGHFGWWWASGIVLSAAFAPVALFGPRRGLAQLAVIAAVLLLVTVICTWTEALVFVPSFKEHALRDLAGSSFMYLLTAIVLAILARALGLARPREMQVPRRSPLAAIPRVVAAGLAYAVYYLVFGGITYAFFTKGYYPEATSQVEQMGLWFWAMQVGRGALMTLAVLPVIWTLRMRRWHAALAVGLLIWVAGGLAPLLVPNEFMGTTQRIIHVVEILTQNFCLGVTAVILLRPRTLPEPRSPEAVAAS